MNSFRLLTTITLALLANNATATLQSLYFSGTYTYKTDSIGLSAPVEVQDGGTFTGVFEMDSELTKTFPLLRLTGDTKLLITLDTGDTIFLDNSPSFFDNNQFNTNTNSIADSIVSFLGDKGSSMSEGIYTRYTSMLIDSTATAFDDLGSGSTATFNLIPADYDFGYFTFVTTNQQDIATDPETGQFSSFIDTDYYRVSGEITSISATPLSAVPVPATAWLFGSALLGLVGIKRRR